MEGRPNRVRGGSWKRGGRGGNEGDSVGGEHRGRGRGGYHRGRGKRDHYRGRGRGGSGPPADFRHRDRDEGEHFEEEDEGSRVEVFSRRKLQSNWERYEESERQEADQDTPAQRGEDYHVLLESAGDSFTQFRFSEEKDWEMDSFATGQMSAVFVDLPALAQSLQQVPLHQRLNLEAELLQVCTPVELPSAILTSNQEKPSKTFTPPSAALKVLSTNQKPVVAPSPTSASDSQFSSIAKEPQGEGDDDDGDEELDRLLGLQKPVSGVSGDKSTSVVDQGSAPPEEACEEEKVKEVAAAEKMEEVKREECVPVRQEVTEEDLEDWLDSMIS